MCSGDTPYSLAQHLVTLGTENVTTKRPLKARGVWPLLPNLPCPKIKVQKTTQFSYLNSYTHEQEKTVFNKKAAAVFSVQLKNTPGCLIYKTIYKDLDQLS